jgi:hypothetical protein
MPQVIQTQKKHQKHSNPNLLNLMDPLNSLHVLIIDEDEGNANHMRDVLHQHNFHDYFQNLLFNSIKELPKMILE